MAAAPPHSVPLPGAMPLAQTTTTYDLFISGDYEVGAGPALHATPHADLSRGRFGSSATQQSEGTKYRHCQSGSTSASRRTQDHSLCSSVLALTTSYRTLSPGGHLEGPSASGCVAPAAGGRFVMSRSGIAKSQRFEIYPGLSKRNFDDALQKIHVHLLQETRIAPSQTRRVPVALEQTEPFLESILPLEFSVASENGVRQHSVDLPVKQLATWTASEFTPVIATHFQGSTALAFVAVPPKIETTSAAAPPLLFLRALCQEARALHS